jgi:hypothetical protein
MTLRDAVLVFLLLGGAMFAFSAGTHFFWYGRGLAGAMEARDAPERVRAASTVYLYDAVITVQRDRVIQRGWCACRGT